MTNLHTYRKSYEKGVLTESEMDLNPIDQFQIWLDQAKDSGTIEEINAMTVSTIGLDGYPKARVVLLKSFDSQGFVFYTNYNSEKGKAIQGNPQVCLSFFWPSLERQVIIKGTAVKTSDKQSDIYFNSRPEGSKKGAIASEQSQVVSSYQELEDRLKQLESQTLERPEHWGGYCVKPTSIEFWQGRPNRLHDRIRYSFEKDLNWKMERLAP